MFLAISNLLAHFGDWLSRNRKGLIKVFAVAAAAILAVYGVGLIQQWRYERSIQAAEEKRNAAEARAAISEAKAKALEFQIEVKEAELRDLETRANAADAALSTARGRTITLKEAYETIRYIPIDSGPDPSCAALCAELAELGRPCAK